AVKQRGSHDDYGGKIEAAGRSQGSESGEDQQIQHHVEVAADGNCEGNLFGERDHGGIRLIVAEFAKKVKSTEECRRAGAKPLLELNWSGIGPARRLPANPARSGRKQR